MTKNEYRHLGAGDIIRRPGQEELSFIVTGMSHQGLPVIIRQGQLYATSFQLEEVRRDDFELVSSVKERAVAKLKEKAAS